MHYLIYKITNRLNNKFYVGKHKTEDKDDGYLGSGILIKKAVKKYGKENFTKELLFECATEEEMNQRETDIVDEDFIERPDTYNVMPGGQGGGKNNWDSGRKKLTDLLKDPEFLKMFCMRTTEGLIEYHKSHTNTFQGRTHSTESREKMRAAKLGKCDGEKNNMFGRIWINDGVVSKAIKKSEPIPAGYKKGRLVKKSA